MKYIAFAMLLFLKFHRVCLKYLIESGESYFYDDFLTPSKERRNSIIPEISETKINPKNRRGRKTKK